MDLAQAHVALTEALVRAADLERAWALAMAVSGAAALLGALTLWLVVAKPVALGAALPLTVLGAIHLVAGGLDFAAATAEQRRVADHVREAPHLLGERLVKARDAVAMRQVLEGVDGFLVVAGLVLLTRRERWRGAGAGVLVMGGLALGFDASAVARQREVVTVLEAFAPAFD